MAATGLRFRPGAIFSGAHAAAHPRTKPHHHCSPRRMHDARGRCRLMAKSANGRPQISASFRDVAIDGAPSEDGAPEQGGSTVSITVVGASGDLAKKKIFPALFALYYEDCLPEHFTVFGYARSKMSDEELRNMISLTLTCRIDQRENCSDKMEQFLKRCFYQSGQYNSEEGFSELDRKLKEKEAGKVPNRLFYLSIPPNIFVDVVRSASRTASSQDGWTRFIVEKPFGRDSESSGELTRNLKKYLAEEQIFRIDHYLGKELVENLSVLRFSNLVFEPLWSRNYIRNVQLIFSEDFGTEGRGGYFDNYGIIRDIMQNHLLQILALFAMETPVSLDAEDIRNEKVKVLRSMRQLRVEDVVVGQYKGHTKGGKTYPAYVDDPTVPSGSITPTFAAAALFIDNARWDGVPFLMKAGKALHTRRERAWQRLKEGTDEQGGDQGAVPAGAGEPVRAAERGRRGGAGQGDERTDAAGAARRGDLPQDQQQGARARDEAGQQRPQPVILREVPRRDPRRLRAPAARRHRGRAPPLHPERRARRRLGHLHPRACGPRGQEGGAGALPVRQPGTRRSSLPRRQLQRPLG